MFLNKGRLIPCAECRQHRRKCIRNSQDRCLRCERLDKDCVPPIIEPGACEELQAEIEQLEWAIHEMEIRMQDLSQHSNNDRTMIRRNSYSNIRSATSLSGLQDNLIQNLVFHWRFQIKNGTFQIETGIRNISDLLRFKPELSYLSPLSSNCSRNSNYQENKSSLIMRFGTEAGVSLVPFTIKLLTQCAKKNVQRPYTRTLPSNLLKHSGLIMDQLISIYFSCHNIYSPMIHQTSYMEKYFQLEDPMEDLLSLCICCYVCSTPCDHVFFTSMERRSMADYFFAKAKSIILDQFDLPKKRLENVMGINLLSKYMHMTLKVGECRKLIIMAYQICVDLRDSSDLFKLSPSEEKVALDLMLYSRHATFTIGIRRLMDYISNEIVDDSCFDFPRWRYMDDEPDEIKRVAQAQNWALGLFNHPFIENFMGQVQKIHLGLVCTLSFESIVHLEDVIKEWSASIPTEFRLCDDLKDMDLCKAAIDKSTDCVLLMSFINLHILLVGMYSCLLQPIALGADNDQLLSIVQQRSLENSLKGCRLLIYTVKRIYKVTRTSSCHYSVTATDFLFHAIDILVLLSLSPNASVAKEARVIMKTCLKEIDGIKFMQEHRVPTNTSPIFSGLMDLNDANTFNLEYYGQYPQPWFAMMYDVSHYIASLS